MLKEFFNRWIGPFDDNASTENATATGVASSEPSTANPIPAKAADVPPQTGGSASDGAVQSTTPTAENGSTQAATSSPQTKQNEQTKCVTTGCLDLRVHDWHGHPIADLEIKVLHDKATVFAGKTGADGSVPTITGLRIGGQFEIRVKRDSGDYKFAAIGTVVSDENAACLASPKTRFEFSTEPHPGASGSAEQWKQQVISSHNQKPAAKPEITGNPDKKPEVKMDRDKNGHPKASVVDGLRNWYNRNADNSGAPVGGVTDVERVKRLLEFANKQTEWNYEHSVTTDMYIKKMHDRTFVEPPHKESRRSTGQCNKYVKIALWYAYHEGEEVEPIGTGIVPAKDMGPALLKAGFVDVTNRLPDARWAAPGDVIVYQDKRNSQGYGHIDIRTYDGYISDFFTARLPVSGFRVLAIYRKAYDPLPEMRTRAFLKVLREWECHQESNDGKRYFLLQQKINGSNYFSGTASHPFANIGEDKSYSGAYQIALRTWRDALSRGNTPTNFTPETQDKIAVWKCEDRGALSFIRCGQIEEAINALVGEWTSLPGGKDVRHGKNGDPKYKWSLSDTLQAYERNLKEIQTTT